MCKSASCCRFMEDDGLVTHFNGFNVHQLDANFFFCLLFGAALLVHSGFIRTSPLKTAARCEN